MARIPITQNQNRYSQQEDKWIISASPSIQAIELKAGASFPVKPLLTAPGVIVKVGSDYLISPQTLKDIGDSKNPHYDIKPTGEIRVKEKVVKTGDTIKILEVKIDGLMSKIEEQDRQSRNAGVRSIDFILEGEKIDGVPKGLVDQINYTLDGNKQRPADGFSIWELPLTGDYSIETLKVQTAQEDGTLDKTKLEEFLKGINSRLVTLRGDFNTIKKIHYEGIQPTGSSLASVEYIQVATSEDTGSSDEGEQIVYKETRMVGMGDPVGTPTTPTGGESGTGATGSNPTGVPGSPELPPTPTVENWKVTYNTTSNKNVSFESRFPTVKKDGKLKEFPITFKKDAGDIFLADKTFMGYLLRTYNPNPNVTIEVWAVMDKYIGDKVLGYAYVPKPGSFTITKA